MGSVFLFKRISELVQWVRRPAADPQRQAAAVELKPKTATDSPGSSLVGARGEHTSRRARRWREISGCCRRGMTVRQRKPAMLIFFYSGPSSCMVKSDCDMLSWRRRMVCYRRRVRTAERGRGALAFLSNEFRDLTGASTRERRRDGRTRCVGSGRTLVVWPLVSTR